MNGQVTVKSLDFQELLLPACTGDEQPILFRYVVGIPSRHMDGSAAAESGMLWDIEVQATEAILLLVLRGNVSELCQGAHGDFLLRRVPVS